MTTPEQKDQPDTKSYPAEVLLRKTDELKTRCLEKLQTVPEFLAAAGKIFFSDRSDSWYQHPLPLTFTRNDHTYTVECSVFIGDMFSTCDTYTLTIYREGPGHEETEVSLQQRNGILTEQNGPTTAGFTFHEGPMTKGKIHFHSPEAFRKINEFIDSI